MRSRRVALTLAATFFAVTASAEAAQYRVENVRTAAQRAAVAKTGAVIDQADHLFFNGTRGLRDIGIGLWDTIVACERRGSLDDAIRNAVRGEVARVRRAAPALRLVCFNENTAARALPAWRDAGYETLALPSSSPAYTRPFVEKLAAWQAIGAYLPWISDSKTRSS